MSNTREAFVADPRRWAEQQFGECMLGDVRRTQRLVDYAARQVAQPEASTNAVCAGDDVVAEGAYRWLRNSAIDPKAVDEGPFQATARICQQCELTLAIQDTTTLTYSHAIADQFGTVGVVEGHRVSGMLAHSTLMVDAHSREPLGLIDQQRWSRPLTEARSKPRRQKITGEHKKRAYEEKESVKWEQASQRMSSRLQCLTNVITVCDREADIYDYLVYLTVQNRRFVIRAAQDRCLATRKGHLFDMIARQPVVGKRMVHIGQRGAQKGRGKQEKRGNRRARTSCMLVRALPVELARPANRGDGPESLHVSVVYLRERHAPKGEAPAEWILLTTESISSYRQIEKVIGYYECRWLIEEFHKAWKTGCRIEQRRLQSIGNLERMMAVTAPIAVRLLQIHSLVKSRPTEPCSAVLSTPQWQCLSAKMDPERPIPKRPPTIVWALEAIARLGGWRDTKRSGRIGWQTLWRGWARLQELAEGWNLAMQRS
jgi:Transposase DNA-binding/Transposase DDE domain